MNSTNAILSMHLFEIIFFLLIEKLRLTARKATLDKFLVQVFASVFPCALRIFTNFVFDGDS